MHPNPPAPHPISRPRTPLTRTRQCLANGALTLGFLGGSITESTALGNNWPEFVIGYLLERFPGLKLTVENHAIGATGSDLAIFRAQQHILDTQCDLVFVEYAVNDDGAPLRHLTREGLLRKLLSAGGGGNWGGPDVVLAYTFIQSFYDDMFAGRVPTSIAEFETLADHYALPSVWMSLHAFREAHAGLMRWDQYLPDNLHPSPLGSRSYATAIINYLETALAADISHSAFRTSHSLPAPLNPLHWESAYCLPLDQVRTTGPWTLRRNPSSRFTHVLATSAPGATLDFAFTGRVCQLIFDFGHLSSEFTYRIDDQPAVTVTRDRPSWMGPSGWPRSHLLLDEPTPAPHTIHIEVTYPATDVKGTNFHLNAIGIVP